jgi:hypothetical protein
VWPRALYEALKKRKLEYDNDTLELHHAANDYAQKVRLPAKSLAENAANCLDGSVLFASLLVSAGIEPVILLVPGHAVVGWKEDAGSGLRYRFLETTLTSVSNFQEACDEGQRQYDAVRQLCEQRTKESLENPRLPFPDPKRFAILIDVKGIWRDKGVAELS